jgi:predicted O-methyltransferase YrrM
MPSLNYIYEYLNYLWVSVTKYKIHSPFLFKLVTEVFEKHLLYEDYERIEFIREKLLRDNSQITIQDFGAGSRMFPSNLRTVKQIAKSSVKKEKYAHLLYMFVRHFRANSILELGTSLGITTSYLASAHPNVRVHTIEGCPSIANIAADNFKKLHLKNIDLIVGRFDDELENVCKSVGKFDLIFVDGNHRESATIDYFEKLLPYCHNDTVLIFDDIHWSEEMEEAWQFIKNHEAVTVTIDILEMGIVFIRKENRQKEHFYIYY